MHLSPTECCCVHTALIPRFELGCLKMRTHPQTLADPDQEIRLTRFPARNQDCRRTEDGSPLESNSG
jgi:hypothetical protein